MVGGRAPIFAGDRAILATMHAKERVIAPLARRFLDLDVELAIDLDTDIFGTFSRDVARVGSQLDAARRKVAAGFDLDPSAQLGIASEGSFGPHPFIPFLPLQREIILLVDRRSGLEIVGHHATSDTNFSHAIVTDVVAGLTFAERIGFPNHGGVVMGYQGEQPAPEIALIKCADDIASLSDALENTIALCGAAFVETDMRAHRNPRRMRGIKRAMIDLIRRIQSRCPACDSPGYAITGRVAGRPVHGAARPPI